MNIQIVNSELVVGTNIYKYHIMCEGGVLCFINNMLLCQNLKFVQIYTFLLGHKHFFFFFFDGENDLQLL